MHAEMNNLLTHQLPLTVTVQFKLVCFDDPPTHNVRLLFVHRRRKAPTIFCLLLANRLYVNVINCVPLTLCLFLHGKVGVGPNYYLAPHCFVWGTSGPPGPLCGFAPAYHDRTSLYHEGERPGYYELCQVQSYPYQVLTSHYQAVHALSRSSLLGFPMNREERLFKVVINYLICALCSLS